MKPNRGFTLLVTVLAVFGLFFVPHLAAAAPMLFFGMAAETTTTALIDSALKVIFAHTLHDDIVAESELMDMFEKEMSISTEETTGGRYIEQGHFWTLPAGAGWRADDEYIPEAVSATFKNSRIYLRKFHIVLQMSGDTMRRVRTDEGAFLDYMEKAKPAIVERANQELDSAYIGYGTGIKARVDAGGVSDLGGGNFSIPVTNHSGITGYTDAWLNFLEGERVVFSSTAVFTALRAAGTTTQSAKVTDINEDSATITFSGNATLIAAIQAGDYIATGDGAGHSGYQSDGITPRAMHGILAAVDDGNILETYNNIDRLAAGNRLWRSIVVDANATFGGTLSEDCLNFAMRTSLLRGNGKTTDFVMSHSARDNYWKSLKGDRFFIDPGGNYKAGRGRLEVVLGDRTYPLKVCRKLPPEVAFGIQRDRFARLTLGQLTWEEETGSMWNRVTDSTGRKDSYYSVAHLYEQLYCSAPRKQFRIDGIAKVN